MPGRRDGATAGQWFTSIGRLLLVALITGAVVGGLTAESFGGWVGEYAGSSWIIGAYLGMPLALLAQVINVIVLLLVRRVAVTGRTLRMALVPVPTLLGLAMSAVLTADTDPWRLVLTWVIPAPVTAVVAWSLSPWCLRPLVLDQAARSEQRSEQQQPG